MLKAILQKGVIVPAEPLPADWQEGTLLEVAKAGEASVDIDAWAAMMNPLCADRDAEDEAAMRRAIEQQRREAREQTRGDMGLSA